MWEVPASFSQFFCEPKTALKSKSLSVNEVQKEGSQRERNGRKEKRDGEEEEREILQSQNKKKRKNSCRS